MRFKITSVACSFGSIVKKSMIERYPFLKNYNLESNENGMFVTINTLEELLELQKLVCSCKGGLEEDWENVLGLCLFPEDVEGNKIATIEIYDYYME